MDIQESCDNKDGHGDTARGTTNQTAYITLGQAARCAPGRPSTNCLWRWCRKGVLARSGERIKLQHIRMGGKIFTQEQWVREFGERLAEADAAYLCQHDAGGNAQPETGRLPNPEASRHRTHLEQVDRELQEAGL